MRALSFPTPRTRPAPALPALEAVRVELADDDTTTVHVARFERARFEVRVAVIDPRATVLGWCQENGAEHAIVGGFYRRPGGPPLGHLRIAGAAVASEPFDRPWDERRACVHTEDGAVALAAWRDLPAGSGGDVLQAGPMLLAAGRNLVDGEDREGFAAGAGQFDSDITAGRYPRAALGISERELIAVVCEGRADHEAGLTMAELADVMIDLGAADAINLDGGGSASLVVDGRLVNTPREEHGIELVGGREVATVLRLVPRCADRAD